MNALTVKEKIMLHDHRIQHPTKSFEKIAKIFSKKLGKKIYHSVAYRTYDKIKSNKEQGFHFEETEMEIQLTKYLYSVL